ncbi:LysR family transcriptional regulator [Pacificimonas sp. WHA3]|uniref:LysR family transcriptional regulator n=1 Tax=Pacificimonas pallii TaxID=2827236 RepID=A0ABS6SBX9_9SPHN|nr:LysR family transcriptional regulator [Pacificimonas pallii]MBV7255865.1 LysR family transcriptional regulator [Pacificimonas pallii]
MDFNWLEDFLAVAEKGHFAHAAEDRNTTQSALSRRIKAVEHWAGAELLDRSSHPIVPTEAGIEFIAAAKEIVARTLEIRGAIGELTRRGEQDLTIASLHTLALYFMPELTELLRRSEPKLAVNVVAETRTLDEYLSALSGGVSDIFVCYDHPAVSPEIDASEFERVDIAEHGLALYSAIDKAVEFGDENRQNSIPYVAFSGTSFMSRVVEHSVSKTSFGERLQPVYRASLAESLFAACQRGLGVAWLPDAIFPSSAKKAGLQVIFPEAAQSLRVCAYRSRNVPVRPLVDRIWRQLVAMQPNGK